MLTLFPGTFLGLLQTMFQSEMTANQIFGPLSKIMHETNESASEAIQLYANDLHLPVTRLAAEYIRRSTTGEELSSAYLHVKRTMHHELQGRVFIETDPKYKQYYRNPVLFGQNVFNAFRSATEDIFEAGNCLALERSTACVMHLNRALESALMVLAATLGITTKNDWGSYIREIGKELDRRTKEAGARSADEQFHAEASANFDRLRRAYRNPTMHPEKTYSQDQAEEILLATRSFMNHLATRLSEAE